MKPEIEVLSGLNKQIYLPRELPPVVCDAGDNNNSPAADNDADDNSHTNDIPSYANSRMVDDNDGGDNSQPADRSNLVENRPEKCQVSDLSWPTVLSPVVLYPPTIRALKPCDVLGPRMVGFQFIGFHPLLGEQTAYQTFQTRNAVIVEKTRRSERHWARTVHKVHFVQLGRVDYVPWSVERSSKLRLFP